MGLLIQKVSLTASDTCRPTKSIILYFSEDRLYYAKFPSLKYAPISLWLNPMGHSKFHNTSNHPQPATDSDSGQTARTPLYPPMQAVPPLLPHPPPFFFLSQTKEPVKASTCAHDRRELQQLALNVHVKHTDPTWPDLTWPASDTYRQAVQLLCMENWIKLNWISGHAADSSSPSGTRQQDESPGLPFVGKVFIGLPLPAL